MQNSNAFERGTIVGMPDVKMLQIPSTVTLREVVIIADCEIQVGAKMRLIDIGLGSRSGGACSVDKANIGVSANVQLGAPDDCADGGGVRLFSNATIHTASSTKIDGVQMVARRNIRLGARDNGIDAISAQAGAISPDLERPARAGRRRCAGSLHHAALSAGAVTPRR